MYFHFTNMFSANGGILIKESDAGCTHKRFKDWKTSTMLTITWNTV